jgi:hypothetical protein
MHAHQYSSPLCTIFVQAAKAFECRRWIPRKKVSAQDEIDFKVIPQWNIARSNTT